MDRPIHSRPTSSAIWTATVAAVLATTACAPSADEVRARHAGGASAGASAPSTAGHSGGALPPSEADYVTAVATSKAALPFTARFRLDGKPRIGQPVTVDFMVTPAAMTPIRSLKFHFEAGEGLSIQGDPEFVVTGATAGISVHRELQVVPATSGLLELRAHATVETASEALSQTYTIPLIVTAATP